jgi:hypothetical protein
MVSTDTDAVLHGARSRYGPAAPLVNIKRLLDEFSVIAPMTAWRSRGGTSLWCPRIEYRPSPRYAAMCE